MMHYLKLTLIACLVAALGTAHAQRIGFIESHRIYNQLPEYQQAVADIETLVANWQEEIRSKQLELDRLTQELEAEKLLLTPAMQEKKKEIIVQKETELREYQNNRFGYQGMLTITEEDKFKPIREKVAAAVERVAKLKRVDFIFDKSADMVIPFANKSRDFTDEVLAYLGVAPK